MKRSEPSSKQEVAVGRSRTEQEVLRVLWASPDEPLVRSQVYKRLPHIGRPTQGRIGQILAALYKEDLLVREDRRAQGARKAGFYALSELGRDLCRRLGFEREERLLFPVTEESLKTHLTRERLAQAASSTGRLVAVYGWRGRLGRTTLVAHVSKGLAEKNEGRQPLLVLDLDLEEPGLNDFFPGHEQCRGFGGLLVDLERRPPEKRALWLHGAVTSREYVLQPLPGTPNLFYMPSGISPGSGSLLPSERVEAMSILRAATGLSANPEARDRGRSSLREMRLALSERFTRTLIDSQSGRTVGSWIVTQMLSDELVICLQVTDTSRLTIDGLRAVLANFIAGHDRQRSQSRILFLFRLTEHTTEADLNRWIDRNLVADSTSPTSPGSYSAVQLPYDLRLATRHHWENQHFYKHVIDLVASGRDPAIEDASPELRALMAIQHAPPEMQALQAVLDPDEDEDNRSIAAGILKNAPLHELARWADWYKQEDILPQKTDTKGRALVEAIVGFQAERLLASILKS